MKLDDGKYEIKREGPRLVALRYGEPWRDLTGDNLIYWLLVRVEELTEQVQRESDYQKEWAQQAIEKQKEIEQLEAALKLINNTDEQGDPLYLKRIAAAALAGRNK